MEYFQNCFAIVLQKNKNDPIKIQAGLLNTVDHAFGEHGKCGSSWCGFLQNREGYKHKSPPHGKGLVGPKLREDLTSLFKVYASKAAMLAPVGSTQANESFNPVVASKAPKCRHYSGSVSLNFRVSAAVCQKNIGQVYLSNVFKRAGIKTHSVTEKFAKKVAARAKKRKLALLSVPYKKRRLELKASRQGVDVTLDAREGDTYKSGVSLDVNFDTTQIPEPIPYPEIQRVHAAEYCFVSVDVETTSLSDTCDIVQLSAVTAERQFDSYVFPSKPIASSASKITGLT